MIRIQSLVVCVLGVAVATAASAAPQQKSAPAAHMAPRAAAPPRGKEAGPRAVGVHVVPHPEQPMHATNNPPHQVIIHNAVTKKDESHPVIVERRPAHIIDHDPRLRIVHRGYHPLHNWGHFHEARGGWWHMWGITAWDTVGTVTCEAANETTGEMYPVSEDRDANGWDDDTVNAVLDQALDDCQAESGSVACIPVSPSCTFQNY